MLGSTSIRTRILALSLLPILALLWVTGNALLTQYRSVTDAGQMVSIAELAPTISNLVHELQKERGQSAGFIGSQGTAFVKKLPTQRGSTDEARRILESAIPADVAASISQDFATRLEAARARIAKLDAIRASVDRLTISVADMAGYYTPLIAELLGAVESINQTTGNPDILRRITGYIALLQGKERAGIERAMGANGFGAGTFRPAVYRKFIRLGAMQDVYFSEFRKYADEAEVSLFDREMSGLDEYRRMVDLAAGAPFGLDISGVSGPAWFATATDRINRLKTVEDKIAGDLKTLAAGVVAAARRALWSSIAMLVGLLAITGMLSFAIIRSITMPLSQLKQSIDDLSAGRLDIQVEAAERDDELGDIGKAIVEFRDKARAHEALSRETDAIRESEVKRQQKVDALISEFRNKVETVLGAVTARSNEMQELITEMTSYADQTADKSTSSTRSAEETSVNVQTVASATNELSASIQEISRQIVQTTDVVEKASSAAAAADTKVSNLNHASQKIGEVISLIQDIAEQTNLLALNATIEAARAGEMGKGFAVVAAEVKTLANQTAKATEEIGQQIGEIQATTGEAVEAISGISEEMESVSKYTSAIAAAIEEQGAATDEISRNVQEASSSIQHVSQDMGDVNAAIDETKRSSEMVRETSQLVQQDTDALKREIESFLAAVSAA